MCAIDDGERCDVWLETNPRAGKEWRCSECGRAIMRGENHRLITSLYDGKWSRTRVCRHCAVGADWLTEECGGYLLHGIGEDIRDHAGEYQSIGLWRLVFGARRKWRRFDGDGLMPVQHMPKVTALNNHGVGT